jgi:D-glycero-alpha-D-manno-heptose-7-phosphate kinase
MENGGAVIGTTINKYCYLSLRRLPPFFEHRHRIVYSKIELTNSINEIEHPSVKAVLENHWKGEGLEVHHQGDLPARSGLGSSSSFTVGLLNAVKALKGEMAGSEWLANEAIRIEQEVIGESVGSQDQVWAAYGGTNLIKFEVGGKINVQPLIISKKTLRNVNDHLLLFFTGFSRLAVEIESEKMANIQALHAHLDKMQRLVFDAQDIFKGQEGSVADLGGMLDYAWSLKKQLSGAVSNHAIDEIYSEGMAAGATGGKLLGAGGGGFMLFFAPPERHQAIRKRLSKLIEVGFEIGSCGSKIVVYEPNGLDHV